MSNIKRAKPLKRAVDAIQSILSESLWLQSNSNKVLRQLQRITEYALGILDCTKFRVYEGDLCYGEYQTITINGFHFDCEQDCCDDKHHLLIKCCYWEFFIPGLGVQLDNFHPIVTSEDDEMSYYDPIHHDDYCGCLSLYYDKDNRCLVPKVAFSDYEFTIIPIV